jgi:hypothetical protein
VPRDVCKRDLQAIVRGTARALRSSRDNVLEEPLPEKLATLLRRLEGKEQTGVRRRPVDSHH